MTVQIRCIFEIQARRPIVTTNVAFRVDSCRVDQDRKTEQGKYWISLTGLFCWKTLTLKIDCAWEFAALEIFVRKLIWEHSPRRNPTSSAAWMSIRSFSTESAISCRSGYFCGCRKSRRSCRCRPVNRNSVTSHNLLFPGAVNLLRLLFNARRDSLRHCIPLEFFRIVPSLSRFCCHLSPRYGILLP